MFKFVVFHVIILFVFLSGCSESSRNETTNNSCCNNSLTSDLGRRIKTECACFLKLFANATRRFNWCLVKHAKPLRMCEKCALQYSEVVARNPVKFNGSRCVYDLVKSEGFQVVMKVYDFQTGLWQSAFCEKCYKSHWHLTPLSEEFFRKIKDVTACFKNYTRLHKNQNSTNSSLCDACRHHYFKLRHVYDRILEDTTDDKEENKLCVDIMSLMNDTRKDWTRFDCNKAKAKNYNVLSLSGLFGFLTFIYYIGVRKHEKYKSKVQSRSRRVRQVVNYDSE